MIRKAWQKKLDFIRKYPITCVWIAWIEGIIIGVFIAWLIPGNIFNIF